VGTSLLDTEADMRDKVESLMYSLKDILCGHLDLDKIHSLCSRLSSSVEFQNPIINLSGINKYVQLVIWLVWHRTCVPWLWNCNSAALVGINLAYTSQSKF
jgi:hypothetical protein